MTVTLHASQHAWMSFHDIIIDHIESDYCMRIHVYIVYMIYMVPCQVYIEKIVLIYLLNQDKRVHCVVLYYI